MSDLTPSSSPETTSQTQKYYPTPYYVRLIDPAYCDGILRIDRTLTDTPEGPRFPTVEDLKMWVIQTRLCMYVALSGQEVVGYLQGERPLDETELATLYLVVVAAEHRRRGVGSLLMHAFGKRVMQKRRGHSLVHKQDEIGAKFMLASGWKSHPQVFTADCAEIAGNEGSYAGDYIDYTITRRSLEGIQVIRSILGKTAGGKCWPGNGEEGKYGRVVDFKR